MRASFLLACALVALTFGSACGKQTNRRTLLEDDRGIVVAVSHGDEVFFGRVRGGLFRVDDQHAELVDCQPNQGSLAKLARCEEVTALSSASAGLYFATRGTSRTPSWTSHVFVRRESGQIERIGGSERRIGALAVERGRVYFTSEQSSGATQLWKIEEGTPKPDLLANLDSRVDSLAARAGSVFASLPEQQRIDRIDDKTGTVEVYASMPDARGPLFATPDGIWFLATESGRSVVARDNGDIPETMVATAESIQAYAVTNGTILVCSDGELVSHHPGGSKTTLGECHAKALLTVGNQVFGVESHAFQRLR